MVLGPVGGPSVVGRGGRCHDPESGGSGTGVAGGGVRTWSRTTPATASGWVSVTSHDTTLTSVDSVSVVIPSPKGGTLGRGSSGVHPYPVCRVSS